MKLIKTMLITSKFYFIIGVIIIITSGLSLPYRYVKWTGTYLPYILIIGILIMLIGVYLEDVLIGDKK